MKKLSILFLLFVISQTNYAQNYSINKSLNNSTELNGISKAQLSQLINEEKVEHKKLGWQFWGLVSIGIASGVLAWDYFSQAKDLQSTIDYFNALSTVTKTKLNTDDLKNAKTRKIIVGASCAVASLMSLIFAFDSIEIKNDMQSVTISYKF